MRLDSPILAILALLCAALIAWIFHRRRVALPRSVVLCGGAGIVMLILAAADLHVLMRTNVKIAVLIDESPSTRSAEYLDEAALQRRLRDLLGSADRQMVRFGANADRTVLPPTPDADALLLFSDGQFDLPAVSQIVYPVIDSALQEAVDAQVYALQFRGRQLAAVLRNSGSPRPVSFSSDLRTPQEAPKGVSTLLESLASNYLPVVVRVEGNDRWPENDLLTIQPPQPFDLERWWIGDAPPDESWRAMAAMPSDPGEYLRAGIIVLHNQPASALPQHRLEQYVRDLGGSLLIVGGDRAFASGDYPGSLLDDLSPLCSLPPQTQTRWVLLSDRSGSMASSVNGVTRAQTAMDAMISVLANLPPEDRVDLGVFARDLDWLTTGKTAHELRDSFKPPSLNPAGPTNLESILRQIDAVGVSTHLLLLTDGQAQFDDPDTLIASFQARRIKPLILLIGEGNADAALYQITAQTQGRMVRQLDAAAWAQSLRQLAQTALPEPKITQPLPIRYLNELAGMPPGSIAWANRVWLKSDAVLLAQSATVEQTIPLAARRQVGEGQVAATAYSPSTSELSAWLKHLTRPPRDPRLRIQVDPGPHIRIHVDARSDREYLNGLTLWAQLSDAMPQAITQTGPGRYELELPPPRNPAMLTIRLNGAIVERIPLAGRYPAEFDEIGISRENLLALAQRSGGRVIEPSDNGPLDIVKRTYRSIASWCAAAAGLMLAAALVLAKRQ